MQGKKDMGSCWAPEAERRAGGLLGRKTSLWWSPGLGAAFTLTLLCMPVGTRAGPNKLGAGIARTSHRGQLTTMSLLKLNL